MAIDPTVVNSGAIAAANLAANHFGSTPDLAQMMLSTQMDMASSVDEQVAGQMKDMQDRSNWLKQANAVMAQLRLGRPTASGSDANNYGTINVNGTGIDVTAWCDQNGVSIEHDGPNGKGDNLGTQTQFDAVISNMKDAMDAANSQSQLDMTRLQGLMDKHNNLYQQMTNTLSSNNDVIKNILQKMGQ